MSSRVRCSLEWDGARYLTNRQVSSAALQIYRRYVGAYYRKVKPPEVPLWKYLSEMWESIPELPESARLRVWREKRGRGRKVVKPRLPLGLPRMREQQVARDVDIGRVALRFTTTQPRPGLLVNRTQVTTAVTNPDIQWLTEG